MHLGINKSNDQHSSVNLDPDQIENPWLTSLTTISPLVKNFEVNYSRKMNLLSSFGFLLAVNYVTSLANVFACANECQQQILLV